MSRSVKKKPQSSVSIHAPARGAIILLQRHYMKNSFNSRTREGCDLINFSPAVNSSVSIHAPARGAIKQNEFYTHLLKFQFTHPRGVRS